MVTQKLDPDQMSVTHTHIETLPGSIKLIFSILLQILASFPSVVGRGS